MVFATLSIAAPSSAVWAHHMFATGAVLLPFFSLMTFLIAVPTGIKFVNWIGTLWRGKLDTYFVVASLEWATSCPPPRHNFLSLPRIRSERPAFEMHYPEYVERFRTEAHVHRRAAPSEGLAAGSGPDHFGDDGYTRGR